MRSERLSKERQHTQSSGTEPICFAALFAALPMRAPRVSLLKWSFGKLPPRFGEPALLEEDKSGDSNPALGAGIVGAQLMPMG